MNGDVVPVLTALICGGFFCLVFGGVGVGLIIYSYKQRQKAAASLNWPAVEAQIVLAEVRESSDMDDEGEIRRTFYPHVEYRYQVAGVTYQGKMITFGARRGFSSPKNAQKEIAAYPVGAQVKAYYNPQNPQEAVLEQRAVGSKFLLIFGIIATLIALCVLCGILWSLIGRIVS
ncbi:MAG: hypothetical protein Kow0088_13790 [Anaerolineales bacterium]